MKLKRYLCLLLAAVFVISSLSGCALFGGPSSQNPTEAPAEAVGEQFMPAADVSLPQNVINVSTVDELLWAIGSNTTVRMAPGKYDLSTAADYGKAATGASYQWTPSYEGYRLTISGIHDFALIGCGSDEVEICVPSPYDCVLFLENVADIVLSGFKAGHLAELRTCAADVLCFSQSQDVLIDSCDLYGCGMRAVYAADCRRLTVNSSSLRDCSGGAVAMYSDEDVRIIGCDIFGCGSDGNLPVIDAMYSDGCAIVNCRIHDNRATHLVYAFGAREVYVLGSEISNNRITTGMFATGSASPVVDACSFKDNLSNAWYDLQYSDTELINSNGETLLGSDLHSMQLSPAEYSGPIARPALETAPETEHSSVGLPVYYVSNADELLAALGSERRIELAPGIYNLSAAESYGRDIIAGYRWEGVYDGYQLVIGDLYNLEIVGTSPTDTIITTSPRYADVLTMLQCKDIFISGITFGHTEEPGYCSGGVLSILSSTDVVVDNSILYGCGILGIYAVKSNNVTVTSTQIYDCSEGAVRLEGCDGVAFYQMDIHDNALPDIRVCDCSNVSYEGVELQEGDNSFYGAVG